MDVHHAELVITSELQQLPQVRDLVAQALHRGRFPDRYLNRLMIVADEAVSNIIEHGYGGNADQAATTIHIALTVTTEEFRIMITDQGLSYDPNESDEVDIVNHVNSGRSGGLGVSLMRKIMDVIEYQYQAGRRNRLLLVKFAGSSSARNTVIS